jgi:hypothetical protein
MPVVSPVSWYRLGDGHLAFQCDDTELRERMLELHADAIAPGPGAGGPTVRCEVRVNAGTALASFEDPDPLEAAAFACAVFADRGYARGGSVAPGWERVDDPGPPPAALALAERFVLADRGASWQRFVGNFAVNRVLRLQKDIVFFHAAAVVVGTRGVLLIGPKGAGKTTLSLALGSQGHGFLGDELVGVRPETGALVPVRRSVTIKSGPAARGVRRALARAATTAEMFPDGAPRRRLPASRLVAGVAPPSDRRLDAIVFLAPFAPTPGVERVAASRELVRRLSPLACSLWAVSPARRAAQLAALVARSACYLVRPADPDDTASLLARTLEE